MTTKLTLTADAEVVKAAKALAAERGTSVSELFAALVRGARGKRKGKGRAPVGALTRRVSGILRVPKERTYRELVEEALSEKYGL